MTNFILIVVDSLRKKDIMEDERVAPFITEMMDQGTYFKNYFSNSPWTAPAHASMFSGKLPSEHGTNCKETYFREKNKLVDYFNNQGFQTIGLSQNSFVSEMTGMDEEFNRFEHFDIAEKGGDIWKEIWDNDDEFKNSFEKYSYFIKNLLKDPEQQSLSSFLSHIKNRYYWQKKIYNVGDPRAKTVINRGKGVLDREDDSFVFMNIMPVHYPYTFGQEQKKEFLQGFGNEKILNATRRYGPEEFLNSQLDNDIIELRRRGYKAAINYADSLIKELYEESSKDTVFVVMGDHGELIGEYGEDNTLLGHHFGTFKELIQVPFLLFSKKDKELEIDESLIYDHRDVLDIFRKIRGEEIDLGRNITQAEYFGRIKLDEQFDQDIPRKANRFHERKSFSILNDDLKFDITSDGDYLWKMTSYSEEQSIRLNNVPEEFEEKGEILYKWRVNQG